MSDEILVSMSIYVQKGSSNPIDITIHRQYIDMTGDIYQFSQQSVGTSAENLEQHADMGTVGIVYAHNLDTTNFVVFGDSADAPSIKLLADQWFLAPWGAAEVSAKADTAACIVEYLLIEL